MLTRQSEVEKMPLYLLGYPTCHNVTKFFVRLRNYQVRCFTKNHPQSPRDAHEMKKRRKVNDSFCLLEPLRGESNKSKNNCKCGVHTCRQVDDHKKKETKRVTAEVQEIP